MVKIVFTIKDKKYQKLEMSGHANAGDYGHDLVCAGLTAIVTGAMNNFDINYQTAIDIAVTDNYITIEVKDLKNNDLQLLMQMLKVQLETIAIQYPKNAKLKEVH
ncbi:hypothetical protein ESOMN_v1c04930 [Williamsoniiplasma somnilux]|uniref:Ribosomal processing cysteine protease Prp n=1 Tax=Williamsoniiplasma somnilux TaxID=215578 RepID=A0A2K8NYH4_9MOLU|nr:ribosomal-processing cysteine protease Prp [Williamsoniiplasma somnilux]ATZ18875.1 hypothetical protein ESOMN_v1c04930 [Williamsoniiplasma somnilux]